MEFHVEDDPDPLDIGSRETQIRREACAAMGLGERPSWRSSCAMRAGSSGFTGWTWGNGCDLQSLWVEPSHRGRWLGLKLIAVAEAEAAKRGCTQTVHFTYDFQAPRLYEWAGYELVGRVDDFPSGASVRWYRKRLNPPVVPPNRRATARR